MEVNPPPGKQIGNTFSWMKKFSHWLPNEEQHKRKRFKSNRSNWFCSLELYKEFIELFKLRQMTPLESRVNQVLNNKFYDSQFVDKFTLFPETPYSDEVTSIRFVYSDRTVQLDRITS